MSRKKGGLGALETATSEENGDLLNRVFGDTAAKSAAKPKQEGKAASDKQLVGIYCKIDKELSKRLKLYCVEHEMLSRDVIEKALTLFLEEK